MSVRKGMCNASVLYGAIRMLWRITLEVHTVKNIKNIGFLMLFLSDAEKFNAFMLSSVTAV